MKFALVIAGLVGCAALVAGCSSSQETSAPAVTVSSSADVAGGDAQVGAILASACYECHSTAGSAPWYAAVSPTYLAANKARAALNFSDWQTYDAERKAEALKSVERVVSSGSMPPGDYTALDHSARLTAEQRQALLKWAAQPAVSAH
jgi:uncharacterized membrane protein